MLDLARDPAETSVTFDEQCSSLELLNLVDEQILCAVTTETVRKKFNKNIDGVRNKTIEGVGTILNQKNHPERGKLEKLADLFEIETEPAVILDRYAHVSSAKSKEWLSNSFVLPESEEVGWRANSRIIEGRAPSQPNRRSEADCIILESFLVFAEECRIRGFPQEKPFFFISSNRHDFMRDGALHEDIAESFEPLGLAYAVSMSFALTILRDGRVVSNRT